MNLFSKPSRKHLPRQSSHICVARGFSCLSVGTLHHSCLTSCKIDTRRFPGCGPPASGPGPVSTPQTILIGCLVDDTSDLVNAVQPGPFTALVNGEWVSAGSAVECNLACMAANWRATCRHATVRCITIVRERIGMPSLINLPRLPDANLNHQAQRTSLVRHKYPSIELASTSGGRKGTNRSAANRTPLIISGGST